MRTVAGLEHEGIRATPEQLLDSAPDGVVIIDAGGVIRLVNRQLEALFGFERSELVGQPVEMLIPERVRKIHPGHRERYFAAPDTRPMGAGLELSARRKDGSEFPVDISLSSLQTDDGVLVSAAIRDITDRKAIEAKFQGLLEAAPDAIIAVDAAGIIHLVNRQAETLFGYARHDLIGKELDTLVPDRIRDLHPGHRASYFTNPTSRPMGAGIELSARRRDGTEFPVDISLSSLETEDGVLVSAAIRDITDRKRIEDEQAELQAKLEQARRDEERATLEAQLHQAQRLESVGQLAGGVAHDFNNLLAGIMNYTSLITDSLKEQGEAWHVAEDPAFATLMDDVGEVMKVAKRGAALTHQLLIFSRREVVKPEVFDLNLIVGDMENLLRRTIGENIDLRTALESSLPQTKIDRGQMEQILMNLVVNARDAMPGGGKLEIKTAGFVVDESFAVSHRIEEGTYAMLAVSDTGTGMTADVMTRAFEPFFTTKPQGAGAGLGLATVYGIVRQAGGAITIYSEPGLGTTIRVALPATTDAAAPQAEAARPQSVRGNGETILLVEDEEIVRIPAQRMLSRQGYTVLVAGNADEALAVALPDQHIDLLLTDVVMPGMSGKDLAGKMTEARPEVRVLYMSGYSEDVIVHQGALEPGVHLIEKPFAAEALLRKVRDVLDE
jgi:PAS domain S-box-containing protein